MKKFSCLIVFIGLASSASGQLSDLGNEAAESSEARLDLIILGTVQDAGSPHIACKKECCTDLFENSKRNRKVVSLGLIDHQNRQTFLFEATPDISEQAKQLKKNASWSADELPNGIFLTHAHIGHYTGLMYLGKEATNAKQVPVYAMPKMTSFLETNGPWSQLVSNKNIVLKPLENKTSIEFNDQFKITAFTVPHRDEYSETVGYKITGPDKSVLFIPDIDKWGKWKTSIISEIEKVDYAFLDATFYDGEELNTRDISQIPHPFVVESMDLFKNLPISEKKKIHWIHFNHTNPLLNVESEQLKSVRRQGFKVARKHMRFKL